MIDPMVDPLDVLRVEHHACRPPHPRPPFAMHAQPLQTAATSLVAWGRNVVLGDNEGRLTLWDTATGRGSSVDTGWVRCCLDIKIVAC